MSKLEQQILDLIQDAFPLVERPYAAIAEMLNGLAANGDDSNNVGEKRANSVISEQEVFEAVERLRASGVIRRIGGVYDSKKLGFISRLCAGKVPASSLDFSETAHEQTAMEKFSAAVNEIPAITHNYIRSHEYNVWFTVIAENKTEIQTIVDKICAVTDLRDVHVMSATRKFKINTVMRGAIAPVVSKQWLVNRDGDECERERHSDNRRLEESSKFPKAVPDLSASDKSRIRTVCGDLPHSLTPFMNWGVSCDELREDLISKRMRRFGAILRHQEAGFAFNAMVCFKIDDNSERRESRPTLLGMTEPNSWYMSEANVQRRKTKDERGECCGTACSPIAELNSWYMSEANVQRRARDERGEKKVILSSEAAKDPVNSSDASLIAQAGSLLASNPHISHCYERPSFDGFPYNVYAMMHANSSEQLNQHIADCVRSLSELQSSPVAYAVLNSVRELKKTSFKFFA